MRKYTKDIRQRYYDGENNGNCSTIDFTVSVYINTINTQYNVITN